MRILQNYILKELIGPFILSIVVFTFILLMGNLIKLAELVITKGVGVIYVIRLFIYLIPYLLSYTIPMASLTTTLLAFGRLSSDNEIVAIKANGISLYRIMVPVIVLGFILSFISVILNDRILPKTHFASRQIVKEIGMKKPTVYLEEGTFIKTFEPYIIFIYGINRNALSNIRIYETQEGKPTRIIIANRGEFITIPEKQLLKLKLMDGSSDEPNPKDPNSFYKLDFETYYLTLDLSKYQTSKDIEKKPKDESINELHREIKTLKPMGVDIKPLFTEIHKKISLSFASIAFILIGLPLGLVSRRGEKSIGFGISLGLIILYYVLLAGGEAMALKGILSPGISVWLPNLLLGMLGIVLIYFVAER